MKRNFKYLIIFSIIIFYFLSRFYRLEELYTFSFDQYRDAWVIKQILIDKKLILIGPQSSFYGIFYGPGWYYSLAPFYWIFALNPIGGAVSAIFYGLVALMLLWYAGEKFFSWKTGLVASLIYIFSYQINFLNRACRNDPPLMAFSLIILYLTCLISKKKQSAWLVVLLGFISGLGLHYHFSAIVFLPMVIISFIFLKTKKIAEKTILLLGGFVFSLFPLIIFELRHKFIISSSILNLSNQIGASLSLNFLQKLYLNSLIVLNNFWQIIIPEQSNIYIRLLMFGLTLIFLFSYFLETSRKKENNFIKVFLIWLLFPVIFFSFYFNYGSGYYFLLNFPIFILILAESIVQLWPTKPLKIIIIFFFCLMLVENFKILNTKDNKRSLRYLNQAIEFIKKDSQNKSIFINHFSKDNFKVGFNYLIYYYDLNKIDKRNDEKFSSYLFYVPAYKNKDIEFKKIYGDIGIDVIQKK